MILNMYNTKTWKAVLPQPIGRFYLCHSVAQLVSINNNNFRTGDTGQNMCNVKFDFDQCFVYFRIFMKQCELFTNLHTVPQFCNYFVDLVTLQCTNNITLSMLVQNFLKKCLNMVVLNCISFNWISCKKIPWKNVHCYTEFVLNDRVVCVGTS